MRIIIAVVEGIRLYVVENVLEYSQSIKHLSTKSANERIDM